MPANFALLERKVLLNNADFVWISEPMKWDGYSACEAFLTLYGLGSGVTSVSASFDGSNEPGQNAIWTAIPASTPSDPTGLSATGVNRYVRNGTLYPWVRAKISVAMVPPLANATRLVEVSFNGALYEGTIL